MIAGFEFADVGQDSYDFACCFFDWGRSWKDVSDLGWDIFDFGQDLFDFDQDLNDILNDVCD